MADQKDQDFSKLIAFWKERYNEEAPGAARRAPPLVSPPPPPLPFEDRAEQLDPAALAATEKPSSSSSKSANSASSASTLKSAGGEDASGASAAVSTALMLPSQAAKKQREADELSLKVLKWNLTNFTTPREKFYAQLREQMEAAGWAPTLVTQCFHADFKFHIKAIDSMTALFSKAGADPVSSECLLANVDLVLKWAALRFFDTNPSVNRKALDLLRHLFDHLKEVGYSMTDMEANSFLPYLVMKGGDENDVVRGKVRNLLHTARSVYPPAKIFSHLMDGLSSKNARQRTTVLEEIAALLESEGMAIFNAPATGGGGRRVGGRSGALPVIAQCVSDRDTGVRSAALACIVKVYQDRGEETYKLLGTLSDKESSLIEERIKRLPKNSLKIGGGE